MGGWSSKGDTEPREEIAGAQSCAKEQLWSSPKAGEEGQRPADCE